MSDLNTGVRLGRALAELRASAARVSGEAFADDDPERQWRRGNSAGLFYAYTRSIQEIESALNIDSEVTA